VRDAALVLNAIAGHDPKDPASCTAAWADFTTGLEGPIAGLRLGVPSAYVCEDLDSDVRRAFWEAVVLLEKAGAVRKDVDLPSGRYASVVSNAIAYAEVATIHRCWFRSRPQDYGDDALSSIATGMCLTAEEYLTAQRMRRAISREVDSLFQRVDVIVAPTNGIPATLIVEGSAALNDRPNEVGYHPQIMNRLPSLLGLPAISVPCGFNSAGLPIGLQVVGRVFDESTVLRVAYAYEVAADWRRCRPPLP
jgi:aspartyl-tRNA(Asn)/glutamyl-tRNA(Gln) amidotransferase subunit A